MLTTIVAVTLYLASQAVAVKGLIAHEQSKLEWLYAALKIVFVMTVITVLSTAIAVVIFQGITAFLAGVGLTLVISILLVWFEETPDDHVPGFEDLQPSSEDTTKRRPLPHPRLP